MDYISKIKNVLSIKQFKQLGDIEKFLKNKMPENIYLHSTETLDYSVKLILKYYPDIFSGRDLIKSKIKINAPGKKIFEEVKTICIPGRDFLNKVCLASILHDYGKIFKLEELAIIAVQHVSGLSDFEKTFYPCLHGYVAPYLIKRDFGIDDKDVQQAIRSHTTGSCMMGDIDRIIYISDKLETRRNYENIKYLRELSMQDPDLCLLEVYKSNIMYVINKNCALHPDTSRIWNYICGGYKNVT